MNSTILDDEQDEYNNEIIPHSSRSNSSKASSNINGDDDEDNDMNRSRNSDASDVFKPYVRPPLLTPLEKEELLKNIKNNTIAQERVNEDDEEYDHENPDPLEWDHKKPLKDRTFSEIGSARKKHLMALGASQGIYFPQDTRLSDMRSQMMNLLTVINQKNVKWKPKEGKKLIRIGPSID